MGVGLVCSVGAFSFSSHVAFKITSLDRAPCRQNIVATCLEDNVTYSV
jgi:hypothetical protein